MIRPDIDLDSLRAAVRDYGFGSVDDALSAAMLTIMQAEVETLRKEALEARQTVGLKYSANIVPLGTICREFLKSVEVSTLLRNVFGEAYALSEGISCVNFYDEGDHLGPHVDKPELDCAATLLVYITAFSPAPHAMDTGLVLKVYDSEPSEITRPRLTLPTWTGGIVIGRGAEIWHERPILKAQESITVLTSCFRRT